jgi:murein DD-endopeptidase MepM/ murein hydrolase activator NlpD
MCGAAETKLTPVVGKPFIRGPRRICKANGRQKCGWRQLLESHNTMRNWGFTRGAAIPTLAGQCFVVVVASVAVLVASVALLSVAAMASPKPIRLKVEARPAHPINGAVCLFKVTASGRLAELRGKWLDHEVKFEAQDNGRSWITIAGTGFATKKGQYPLELDGKSAAGSPVTFMQKIRVAIEERKTIAAPQPLTVEGRFTSPDPETLKRIDQDKAAKTAAYDQTSPHALWSGPFERPLDSVITETFGVRRMFNGQLLSEHHGVDFRAPAGTPVLAANSGTVVLARELFYEGNCVFLDHGQGLFTIYMHFSKFAVHEGEHVVRGQQLGESGATGRVTGPHLHVSVLWRGVALDLLSLTALEAPDLHPDQSPDPGKAKDSGLKD